MKTMFFDKKLLKFLFVSVANTIVGTGLMFMMYNVLEVSYWLSSACNYVAGGILSFFLNKFFTFKNTRKSPAQILLFALNVGVCYLIAYAGARNLVRLVLWEISQSKADNIAMLCGMVLYTALNYVEQRLVVFADKPNKEKKKIE